MYMQIKRKGLVFFAAAFWICFQGSCRADSTLVNSDRESITILSYTKYLDNHPLLIFSEQLTGDRPGILDQVDNLVIYDGNWQDLALELCQADTF